MNDEEWYQESHWRLNRVSHLFKKNELTAIIDFLRTCAEERQEAEQEEVKKAVESGGRG